MMLESLALLAAAGQGAASAAVPPPVMRRTADGVPIVESADTVMRPYRLRFVPMEGTTIAERLDRLIGPNPYRITHHDAATGWTTVMMAATAAAALHGSGWEHLRPAAVEPVPGDPPLACTRAQVGLRRDAQIGRAHV